MASNYQPQDNAGLRAGGGIRHAAGAEWLVCGG
jgi:hypothetical protein